MMTLNLRYYDPFCEEMVYSSEFPAMSNFFISYEKRVAAGNEPILMVSTGLKDKNGKEIYEGDKVETTHSVRIGTKVEGRGRGQRTYAINKETTECGIVEFNEGMWVVKFDSFDDYHSYFFVTSTKDRPKHMHTQIVEQLAQHLNMYEVIGNIYEDEELLSGT